MPASTENFKYDLLKESGWDRKTVRDLKKAEKNKQSTFSQQSNTKAIPLPRSWELDEARIAPLMQNRRSLRKYSELEFELESLAFILWASHGITAKTKKHFFRTVPSAGALYPFSTYIQVNKVEGLEKGIYHFSPEDFSLSLHSKGNFAASLSQACLGQKFIEEAPFNVVWTGLPSKCTHKYGTRALRYLLLDLGHVCQNILIAAEAVGGGGCPVASFYDDEVNGLLKLSDQTETALYIASVGEKIKKDSD